MVFVVAMMQICIIQWYEIVCYAQKICCKGLVASHIKPSEVCLKEGKPEEAYDYNNGLLLQPNVDAYFDKFDISFDENGTILFDPAVTPDIINKFKDFKLDKEILNSKRLEYLKYHREKFNKKSGKSSL